MAARSDPVKLRRVVGPRLLMVFIVGDILGTGIYALLGQMAGKVGGAVWIPFLLAFLIAAPTALSYVELVTKYPEAAGSATYVHRAFRQPWLTALTGFALLAALIGSAATGAHAFAAQLAEVLGWDRSPLNITGLSLGVVVAVMAVNVWGVREGLVMSMVITTIEFAGLMIVLVVALMVTTRGDADLSRPFQLDSPAADPALLAVLAATSFAFFAMVGFEDSVNLAEEAVDPTRSYPSAILGGLAITAVLYVLIGVAAVAVVPPVDLAQTETPLTTVVARGLPGFPAVDVFGVIAMCALAHTTLLNLLTASRLTYGMARHGVLPHALTSVLAARQTPWLAVLYTSLLAGLLVSHVAHLGSGAIGLLAGTTSLLHLALFAVVNVTVLVLRKHPVAHRHFRTHPALATGAAIACLALTLPWTGRDAEQYLVAAGLIALGMTLAIPSLRTRTD